MTDNKAQGAGSDAELDASKPPSPSEKLEGNPPEGSGVPGAQNPESDEIKEEASPNTE